MLSLQSRLLVVHACAITSLNGAGLQQSVYACMVILHDAFCVTASLQLTNLHVRSSRIIAHQFAYLHFQIYGNIATAFVV